MNIELIYPWLLLLLPLPFFIHQLIPAYLHPSVSLYVPFFFRFVKATGQTPTVGASVRRRKKIQGLALILSWIGVIICLTRPVLLGEVQVVNKTGRDLMIAVDLSQSMEQKDYLYPSLGHISRLEALKKVLVDFSSHRDGDRLGLIVFGSGAYLQVPFTQDIHLWQVLLNEMETQMAGPATAIGDAVGLSIRAFAHSTSKQRLLLLVTDGSDTSSRLDPVDAARVAASENITVYTIAMGDPNTEGDDKVDFNTLNKIAKVTKGKSYVASDADAIKRVLEDVNQIAPAQFEQATFVPKTDIYPWIMGPLLLLYLCLWFFLSGRQMWRSRQGDARAS
ncbi:VWA domain-containing protein [Shewanella sp. VB17]|uniref:VWA domain-containing protein n=1 Tax=Shewanella sp. VB17 TaxID=2739432 RepID=UPI001564697A|nr:VWA domain-containing protein [Shewanella sp. VB17]NRD74589.1 VWA domain-containing protein [Shewanella sp. VB17]